DDDAALVASVSVPLPFRHRNDGNIRAARHAVTQSEQLLRAAEIELRATFSAAWRELEGAYRLARQLRQEALPPLADAVTSLEAAFARGEASVVELIAAQQALFEMNREIVDAEFAYVSALVRVETLADP